jgi:sortase A
VRRSAGDVVRAAVGTLGELSITLGVLLLLFVAWQLWWTDVEATREQDRLTDDLVREWAAGAAAPDGPVGDPVAPVDDPVVAPEGLAVPVSDTGPQGAAFAVIRVPRFGDDYARPVLSGTSRDILEDGVGHYDGSVGPGEVGNFALAGHRTTYGAPFSRIAELRAGDPIVIQTVDGYYTYRVTTSQIVLPSQTEVVAPVPGQPGVAPTEEIITLTSCHPRYSARQRYIVHGQFESFRPASAGPPAVLAAG